MIARSDRPLRVLQVSAGLDPTIGGPPVATIQTVLALGEQGLVNELAYVFDVAKTGVVENVAPLRRAGIVMHGFPVTQALGLGVRWGFSPRFAWWLVRNARRYDVLHMHGAWTFTTLVGLLSARIMRRIAVLSPHESLTDFDRAKSSLLARLVKRTLRRFYLTTFSAVVVASGCEQRDSGDPVGRRSVVIPHAVPLVAQPARVPTSPRRRPLVVGFLGRLHAKKNLDVVIESIARLDDKLSLWVAGDGPERDRLLRLARERRVDERIAWLGFVREHEKPAFLRGIDLLVMPSAYESFGVSAVEALAAGVPVIVSPAVGVADVVRRYGCGLVVDADAASVADALARLAREPALLERLRRTTTAAVEAEFSAESHGRRLRAEYLRLVGRPFPYIAIPRVGDVP